MKAIPRLLSSGYGWMLRGYPEAFRSEFGSEMRQTFAAALDEAAGSGPAAALKFWLRELVDWPGCLLREHSAAWRTQRKELPVTPEGLEETPNRPGSWGEALLGGLPHLLFALALAPGLYFGPLGGVWILAFAVLVAAALATGGRRGWPRWSATWLGYAYIIAIGGALQIQIHLPTVAQRLLLGNVVTVAWLALFPLGLIWALRKSLMHGLLLALPVAPMGYWVLIMDEMTGRFPEVPLYLLAGAMMAAAVVAMLWIKRLPITALLALGTILVVNLGMAWGSYNYPAYLGPRYTAPAPTVENILAGGVRMLLIPVVVTAPVWLAAGWLWARRLGRGQPPQA